MSMTQASLFDWLLICLKGQKNKPKQKLGLIWIYKAGLLSLVKVLILLTLFNLLDTCFSTRINRYINCNSAVRL